MTLARRLPIAPRPYRDELLSSWLGRVGCRYGLDARRLCAALADATEADAQSLRIDDVNPEPGQIRRLARLCGVDPARVSRLALARRHPERSTAWFLAPGPQWSRAAALGAPPVCVACFEADRAAGRDDYLRADWMLAERCVCRAHRRLLLDCCPHCGARLHVGFRLRDGQARAICRECEEALAARSAREKDGVLEALISVQSRVDEIVRGAPERRGRLETALSTLWAPLDDPGAARPVLALWIDDPGWRCTVEAQGAIGAPFPLGRLPIGLRIATLIAADAAFGLGNEPLDDVSGLAALLLRRAAPLRRRLTRPRAPMQPAGGAQGRPRKDYRRLAREILTSPEWRAAVGQPEPQRRRVLSRLMDAALAARPAEACLEAPVQR